MNTSSIPRAFHPPTCKPGSCPLTKQVLPQTPQKHFLLPSHNIWWKPPYFLIFCLCHNNHTLVQCVCSIHLADCSCNFLQKSSNEFWHVKNHYQQTLTLIVLQLPINFNPSLVAFDSILPPPTSFVNIIQIRVLPQYEKNWFNQVSINARGAL